MNLKTLLITAAACAMATSAFAQGQGANMDTNGDGKTDKAEYGASAKAMFDRMDADKDGKISAAEQAAGGGGGGGGGGRGVAGADADKDGSITLAELQAQRATRFDQMDTNKDGSLSQEERAAGRQAPPAQ